MSSSPRLACTQCGADSLECVDKRSFEKLHSLFGAFIVYRCRNCRARIRVVDKAKASSSLSTLLLLTVLGVLLILSLLVGSKLFNSESIDIPAQKIIQLQRQQQGVAQKLALIKTNQRIASQIQEIEKSKALQSQLLDTVKVLKRELAHASLELGERDSKLQLLEQRGMALKTAITTISYENEVSVLAANASDIDPEAFTIQLASLESQVDVLQFVSGLKQTRKLDLAFFYYLSKKQIKPWYPVLYGAFSSKQEAIRQMSLLPKNLQQRGPLVRQIKTNSEPMILIE